MMVLKLLLKEGRWYIAILAVLAVILYFVHPVLVGLPFLVFLFLLYFFRDPIRTVPSSREGEEIFLSPADGRVTVVAEVDESYLFSGRAKLVTIFLSPLDVHVNRSPIAGKVVKVEHRKGLFKPAYIVDAPSVNERNYVVVSNDKVECLLVQIVGVLARRVVCWVTPGDNLEQGEKFGLMKFGSCMQVFMPVDVEVLVKPGMTVTGGETIIGVLRHANMG